VSPRFYSESRGNRRLNFQLQTRHRLLFQNQLIQAHKSPTTAFVLTLLLGGVGAHRFYMRDCWLGLLYAIFCWTFVPVIVSLIELVFIGARVEKYNRDRATEIAEKLKMLSPTRPQ